MRKISLYMTVQIIPWIVLSLVGFCLLFITAQILRVAPIFAWADAGFAETVSTIALTLVPVIGWALTPAFVMAVFATVSRMDRDGELTAFDASGLSRKALALGPILLALILTLASGWIWLQAGPSSQAAVREKAFTLAGRAMAGSLRPGIFNEPIPGITFFADKRGTKGIYHGVLLEDTRHRLFTTQFVTESAEVSFQGDRKRLTLKFERGSVFFTTRARRIKPAALSFETLNLQIPIGQALDRRLDFLPERLTLPTGRLAGPAPPGSAGSDWGYALWRRIAGPLGFLALALVAIALALGRTWQRRSTAVLTAGGLFLVYHLLCRVGESLMGTGAIGAKSAALLPSAAVTAALIIIILRPFPRIGLSGRH
jgi:lipopolysaccharide export system permease protein